MFELIVISREDYDVSENQIVSSLFENGLASFHLRKPGLTEEKLSDFIHGIPLQFHGRIVLHSHFYLTEKYKLKGVHGKPGSSSTGKKIISASFHALEEIESNHFPFEYVFLSPIFDSISKPGYRSKFDLTTLSRNFEHWQKEGRSIPKVIALGGIHSGNISSLTQIGFSGAALSGSIWESKDPIREFLSVLSATKC
jgi:thiamine-phosphate pyrophosphorylase